MAFTNPEQEIWSVGEMAGATNLNIYHRDNYRAAMHRHVRKRLDTARNTTSITPDPHMRMWMWANESWLLNWYIMWTDDSVSTYGKLSVKFTGPSGSAIRFFANHKNSSGLDDALTWDGSNSNNIQPADNSVTPGLLLYVVGSVKNGTTPGYLQLEWGQAVAVATTSTVKASSMLFARRI